MRPHRSDWKEVDPFTIMLSVRWQPPPSPTASEEIVAWKKVDRGIISFNTAGLSFQQNRGGQFGGLLANLRSINTIQGSYGVITFMVIVSLVLHIFSLWLWLGISRKRGSLAVIMNSLVTINNKAKIGAENAKHLDISLNWIGRVPDSTSGRIKISDKCSN